MADIFDQIGDIFDQVSPTEGGWVSPEVASQFAQKQYPEIAQIEPYRDAPIGQETRQPPEIMASPAKWKEAASSAYRPLMEFGGLSAGAALGTAGEPGLGTIAGGAVGFATGREGANVLDRALGIGVRRPAEFSDLPEMGKGVLRGLKEGAEYTMAGEVAAPAIGVLQSKMAPRVDLKPWKVRRDIAKSEDLLSRGIKPTSSNVSFGPSLSRSMPELKITEKELGRPIQTIDDLMESIHLAKQRVRGQRDAIAGPNNQLLVDTTPVADAMEASISKKMWLEDPARAQSILDTAAKYRAKMPVQDADEILVSTNAALDGYYAKNPAMRGVSARANPEIAATDAQANALRDVVYKTLDSETGGEALREVQKRYGALMKLEREVYRRYNPSIRQQPNSLSEQFGKWVGTGHIIRGAGRMLAMDVGGGIADIAGAVAGRQMAIRLKEAQTTNALIRKAFQRYPGSPSALPGAVGAGEMAPPIADVGLTQPVDMNNPNVPTYLRQGKNIDLEAADQTNAVARGHIPNPTDYALPAPERGFTAPLGTLRAVGGAAAKPPPLTLRQKTLLNRLQQEAQAFNRMRSEGPLLQGMGMRSQVSRPPSARDQEWISQAVKELLPPDVAPEILQKYIDAATGRVMDRTALENMIRLLKR